MRIKSLPEGERPVEKTYAQGVNTLSNTELMAILISSGTRDKSAISVAQSVIASTTEGISHLRDINMDELMKIEGIGMTKAARIMAAIELGRRLSTLPPLKHTSIESSEDIARLFIDDMRGYKKEVFKALLLNAKGEIISRDTISIGELTSTLVHPREVFSQAIRRSAAAIVVVHNHPSGDPTPSKEDIKTTSRLKECGELLGINLIDHIVIGDGRYVSLRSMGYL